MCIYVNQVGDEGARRLARVVRTNTALRTLSLTHNGLGGEGGEACVRALASRSSMTDLFLGGNGLSKALMEAADVQLTRIAQARSTVRGAMSQHALAAVVAAGAGAAGAGSCSGALASSPSWILNSRMPEVVPFRERTELLTEET